MNESRQKKSTTFSDDEIDLRELFKVLWAGKWLIVSISSVAAIMTVAVALMLPNMYKAEALLAPNNQQGNGGLSALATQYGDLASFAGINLDSGSIDKTSLGLEVLKSRKFISEFIVRHNILVPLMAAEDWDASSGELKIDSNVYDLATERWMEDAIATDGASPSLQEAQKKFMEIFSVSQDKQSGFVSIAVEHYSPIIARQWVDWLVDDINFSIMLQDVSEAEQAIAYLNEQIESTSLADLQNVFFKLIEEQTKIVMLAKVSPEYVLRTIDPAVAPEKKSRPSRALICILGTLLGGILGVTVVLIRRYTFRTLEDA
jgi:LPS O-antigen subunit length determinant protein (WzzB/FepE family)